MPQALLAAVIICFASVIICFDYGVVISPAHCEAFVLVLFGYAGISLPEMEAAEGEGGLGGSDFSVGYFTVDTYQMGDLSTVNDMLGLYGVFPETYYFDENFGLFVDGIISHTYLKNYKWTIDFDSMTMTFSK